MASCKTSVKTDLRMLDAKKLSLRRDSYGRLRLEVGFEERYGPVRAVRCLPLTQPEKLISLQDDEGEEIGIIPDATELDAESRKELLAELDLYYLKARVTAIQSVESKNGILTWELETDLGTRRVHVRDRQHIRPLPNGCTILTDIHGAKYEIPPIEALDAKSRQNLETEL